MTLAQAKFLIRHLFLDDYALPIPEFWLKDESIVLKPTTSGVAAFALVKYDEKNHSPANELTRYLEICSLASLHAPILTGGGLNTIKSKNDLGVNQEFLTMKVSITYTDEQKRVLAPEFQNYLKKTRRLFEDYGAVFDKAEFLGNALAYYHRACTGNWYSAGQYVDAAIALEYLYNEAPNDIAYKVAARSAVLLSLIGKDPAQVFREVKTLYNKRNGIVHGQGGKPSTEETTKIMAYSRASIKCFCLLCVGMGTDKKKIIDCLDDAIVDVGKRSAIAKHLGPLKDFELGGVSGVDGKWKISW